jgi:hypothetical protein
MIDVLKEEFTVVSQIDSHPIACMFPMLPEFELQKLADDIREHGQLDPIVLFQGDILDGRNRWHACHLAGVEPRTVEFNGSYQEAIEFVWSTNFLRRHLGAGQAAMAISERKELDPEFMKCVVEPLVEEAKDAIAAGQKSGGKTSGRGRSKENSSVKKVSQSNESNKTRTKIAKMHGTNATYVAMTDEILSNSPELIEDIKTNKISVKKAFAKMQETLNPKAPASVVELVSLSDALRAATRKTSVTAEYLAKRTGIAQSKIQAWLDLSEQANGFKAVKQSDGSFAIHRQKIKSDRQFVASVKSQSIHGDATPVEHLASDLDCIAMKIEGVLRTYGESCKDVSAWKQIGDDDRKNLLAMLCSVQAKVDLYFPEFITRVSE